MPNTADIYYHAYEGGEEGEKPPVVLIHGAGGTHLYWPSEIRRLPGYRVYALDLPGHGKSGGCGQQSITDYAQIVLNWLEAMNIHRAIFVGHSMGSAVALSLALEEPGHVLGLGLIGAAAHLPTVPAALESTANPTTFLNAVEIIISQVFSPDATARLVELAAQRMAETRPGVLHGDFVASSSFDVAYRVAEIRQPTLILCGSEDRMTPVRQAQFLADAIPNARLEVVPGAGHMVMLEQPLAVASILAGFLKDIPY